MSETNLIESIEAVFGEMRGGSYGKSDAAVLITRDAKTGILTFSYHGVSQREGQQIFAEAARVRGWTREH